MNSYNYMDDLWICTLKNILLGNELESRVGGCTELIGWQCQLQVPQNNIVSCKKRKFSGSYACAEFLWYLSMSNSIEMIKAYAPSYVNYSDDGKTVNGAYGHRWKHNAGFEVLNTLMETKFTSQLDAVIQILKNNPNSRQAVMSMWDSKDIVNSAVNYSKDTPCTLTHTFFLRCNRLHLVSNMRSNDVWLGMPYDIFCNTNLQSIVAQMIGAYLGTYTHQVGSLHLYDKHRAAAQRIVVRNTETRTADSYTSTRDLNRVKHDIQVAIELEQEIRARGMIPLGIKELLKGSLMRDIVLGCASKWTSEAKELIYSSNLKAVL